MKKAAAVLLAVIILSAAVVTSPYRAAGDEELTTVLNAAQISYEQLELCMDSLLDGFEADGTVRTPLEGSALYTDGAEGSFSRFEGESRLMLSGTDRVGAELSFLKHPPLSKCRGIAISLFIKPAQDGGSYSVSLAATGTDATVRAEGEVPAGSWQTLYLPFGSARPGQLVSVTAAITAARGGEIEAALDCLHTSNVDGMPEDLALFASDFTCSKGSKISYSDGALVFAANGRESYIESSLCNYILTEKHNTLAITIENGAKASSAVLSCRLNGAAKFTETDSFERELGEGTATYYFRTDIYRGDNVLNYFRLTFPDKIKGEIKIKKIELTAYRYPVSYPGTLTVSENGETLKISGSVQTYPAGSEEIRLYRLLPGEDEERFEELNVTPYRTAEPAKTFSLEIPRKDGDTDNALYKYFAVYYGDTPYYAAPAAYLPTGVCAHGGTGEKCVSLQSDLSVLALAEPDTVFMSFDAEKLFCEDGTCDEEYFAPFDAAADRLRGEGFGAAALITFAAGIADIGKEEGFSLFVNALTAVSDRYGDILKAVIPGGALNGKDAVESAVSDDRAVRYAAALARTAAYVLSPRGINTLLPVSADGEGCGIARFLDMLKEEKTDGVCFGFAVSGEDEDPDAVISAAGKISAVLSSSLTYNGKKRELVACMPFPKSETELVNRFCRAAEYCGGVYFCGAFCDDGVTDLFAALCSADGTARVDSIIKENGGFGAALLYPRSASYKNIHRRTEITDEAPEGSVSVLFDGKTGEGQTAYDSCRDIYQGAVGNDPAAELEFDFSLGDRGKAVFETEEAKDNGAVYIRLYADYLPADEKTVEAQLTVTGENGCVYGYCTLRESETESYCIKTDGLLGSVRKVTVYVKQNESGTLSTPRICVLGVYAADAASEQTVTEEKETEPPQPETQVFVTETEAATEEPQPEEDGTGRLLLITLCVMISMFAVCGAVIFIMKKTTEKKRTDKE